jgi:hypothetical protein
MAHDRQNIAFVGVSVKLREDSLQPDSPQSIILALFPFLPEKSRGTLYDFVTKTAVSEVT